MSRARPGQGESLLTYPVFVASLSGQSGYIEHYMTNPFKLVQESPGICRVLTAAGLHVGNLKLIGGAWKFKAIGYDVYGQVVPGGGPLTDRHNMVFAAPDEEEINQILG
jgi:hypothetical protein